VGAPSEAPSPERLIALGYVSRAHGVHGELRVERFHEASEVLLDVETIVLRPRGTLTGRSYTVREARESGKAVLVALEGVESREAAEALRAHEVCVPRSALPEPGDDEVYLADLVGLDAREDGRSIGRVEDVVHHPAADCARIATERGTIEVPLAPPYLVEVDLRDRVLVVAHTADFEPEAR
jgi:16S rRNA processing protein RimM